MKPETVPLPAPHNDDDDRYVGATLASRYKIVRRLAEGAQARVYVAQHTRIGRHVAIKVLLPALSADRDLVKRFLNEGRAAGTLGHPNIVEFLDMGVAPDGLPYLVMELLEGTSLAYEISRNGPFAPGRAAYVAAQIASAVSLANQRGIIHRDLKPENVFLTERGERPDHVKVLDFGISKIAGVGTFIGTAQGRVLGTPGFMAPEQLESPGSVDERADVYGLGATLYDMLAGAPPFAETDFLRLLRVITEEKPRSLGAMRGDLPPELVAVVERAMCKAPSGRYQTMAEFEQALAPFVVEPQRRKTDPTSGSRIPFSQLPPGMLLIDEPTPMPLPLLTPRSTRPPPPMQGVAAAPAPISDEASRALLAKAARDSHIPDLASQSGQRAPVRMRQPPAASAYWLHTIVVGLVTAVVGIAGLRWSSGSRDEPTPGAEAGTTTPEADAPEPQAASGPATQAAAEPQAPTAPAPRPTAEAGRPAAPAPTAPPASPPKARTASHPHPPPHPTLAAPHPRSSATAASPPAATPAPAQPAQPAQPASNCEPPYYFEGTKKLYKPGCL